MDCVAWLGVWVDYGLAGSVGGLWPGWECGWTMAWWGVWVDYGLVGSVGRLCGLPGSVGGL